MPGPFNEAEFNIALADFSDKADAFCKPTWTLHKDSRGRYYARQSTMIRRGEGKNAVSLNRQVYIAYNPAYGVPVLWFNFYHRDGQSLTSDEVLELVATPHRMALGRDLSTAIAANEQPQLGVLFYHFHPCHTAQLLAELRNSKNLFLSWLSIYAPVIGIQLPVEILKEAILDSLDTGTSSSTNTKTESETETKSGVDPPVDLEEAASSSQATIDEETVIPTLALNDEEATVDEVREVLERSSVEEEKEEDSIPDDPTGEELEDLAMKTRNGHIPRAETVPLIS